MNGILVRGCWGTRLALQRFVIVSVPFTKRAFPLEKTQGIRCLQSGVCFILFDQCLQCFNLLLRAQHVCEHNLHNLLFKFLRTINGACQYGSCVAPIRTLGKVALFLGAPCLVVRCLCSFQNNINEQILQTVVLVDNKTE